MKVVVSLCQGRTAAAQCGLFTYKSVPVIFEPPCIISGSEILLYLIQCSLSCQNGGRRKIRRFIEINQA